ncbi:hypothetical protein A8B75_03660 [Sphingomonadales bacterium EhC05]|nr:hypothetical protein A8B75_03660 [Sphingomonadales bacterium EhC05]
MGVWLSSRGDSWLCPGPIDSLYPKSAKGVRDFGIDLAMFIGSKRSADVAHLKHLIPKIFCCASLGPADD